MCAFIVAKCLFVGGFVNTGAPAPMAESRIIYCKSDLRFIRIWFVLTCGSAICLGLEKIGTVAVEIHGYGIAGGVVSSYIVDYLED